jgi:hypothetical protein
MNKFDKIKGDFRFIHLGYTSTINLARSSNQFANYAATAHGFGKYNDASDVSDFLRYASVPVISNAQVERSKEKNSRFFMFLHSSVSRIGAESIRGRSASIHRAVSCISFKLEFGEFQISIFKGRGVCSGDSGGGELMKMIH